MPPQQVILFIIGTVAILFAAYYVTYFIGTRAQGKSRAGMRNRNIAVRDLYSISRDKSFCVVEVAGKVYVLGITNSSMTLLDTYDADEYETLAENNPQNTQMPWADTPVGRYGNKLTKKVVSFIASKTGKLPQDEKGNPYNTAVSLKTDENSSGGKKEEKKSSFAENLKKAAEPDDTSEGD